MKDIIDSIKQQIKEKKGELARLEAALGKLEGDKPAPKQKAAPTARASTGTEPANGADGTSLPDRIIADLKVRDEQPADSLAQGLGAPLGQVRTTCSRLAREGRITSVKRGKTVFYLSLKSETPTTTNPFTEGAN